MNITYLFIVMAGIACWLQRRTRDRKVASSYPGRSGGKMFFSIVNFLCSLLLGVLSSLVILPKVQVAVYT